MAKPKFAVAIRDFIDASLSAFVLRAHKIGVVANYITLLQAPFVVAMFYFMLQKNFIVASLLLGMTLILDVLDGAWARITKEVTAKGHFYDKALDLFGIYAFLLGLGIAERES